jgi:hypothetical protein
VGSPEEDEERGLEGVLGVVGVSEKAPADTQDHGPMPSQDGRESVCVTPRGEAVQQLGVRSIAVVRRGEGAEEAKHRV